MIAGRSADNCKSVQLEEREYMCDEYSIVDIAHFGWLYTAKRMGFGFEQFPNIAAWLDRLLERPAVAKGIVIPAPLPM